jgi:hypothetical protein
VNDHLPTHGSRRGLQIFCRSAAHPVAIGTYLPELLSRTSKIWLLDVYLLHLTFVYSMWTISISEVFTCHGLY